jgi:hypothetical protein
LLNPRILLKDSSAILRVLEHSKPKKNIGGRIRGGYHYRQGYNEKTCQSCFTKKA